MNAIETSYNGYKFRSRLEARWARFFDVAGIKYQHEPEGYWVSNIPYLPDFLLLEHDVFLEIKPPLFHLRDSNDPEWVRHQVIESLWNAPSKPSHFPLYLIAGEPRTGHYSLIVDGEECILLRCRRCAGLCYQTADGSSWGEFGRHTKICTMNTERWPSDAFEEEFQQAMEHRFEHRNA